MGKFKLRITKTQIAGAAWVVALLTAFAGIGMLAWWLQNKNQAPQGDTSSPSQNALPEDVSKAQQQAANGNTDQAVETIQNALNKPGVGDAQKRQLLIEQGVTYGNSGQYQKALDAYLKADAITSDDTSSHLIAESYESMGDKPKAIEYFKKTITQLNTASIGYKNDKDYYEAKVKELGGTL